MVSKGTVPLNQGRANFSERGPYETISIQVRAHISLRIYYPHFSIYWSSIEKIYIIMHLLTHYVQHQEKSIIYKQTYILYIRIYTQWDLWCCFWCCTSASISGSMELLHKRRISLRWRSESWVRTDTRSAFTLAYWPYSMSVPILYPVVTRTSCSGKRIQM